MIKKRTLGLTLTSTMFSIALPTALFAMYFADRPFSRVLSSKTISLVALTSQQKLNIENAARRINGAVIKPNERFSFNTTVGPRSTRRGYLPAPSYVGKGTPETIGGGICLLSSALYQDALETGFEITDRSPHMRAVHSVPPGLDATVWYGDKDLAFKNNLESPVEVVTNYTPNAITVEVRGDAFMANWRQARITRDEQHLPGGTIDVCVHATQYGKTTLVSHDVYNIPVPGEHTR